MYYKLKQPFQIDKQKSCFPQLNYLIKTPFTYLKVLHLCLQSDRQLQFALGVSLACVLHWMCLLFNGMTGNHNVWTPFVQLVRRNVSEKFFLSCSLSLQRYLVSSGCNLYFVEFLHRHHSFLLQDNIFNELKYCFIVTKFLLSLLLLDFTLKR